VFKLGILYENEFKGDFELRFNMYIDYDVTSCVFYHNFFFINYDFVLKIALTPPLIEKLDDLDEKELQNIGTKYNGLRLERHEIDKYIPLLYYG